jgi:hypothetical protein
MRPSRRRASRSEPPAGSAAAAATWWARDRTPGPAPACRPAPATPQHHCDRRPQFPAIFSNPSPPAAASIPDGANRRSGRRLRNPALTLSSWTRLFASCDRCRRRLCRLSVSDPGRPSYPYSSEPNHRACRIRGPPSLRDCCEAAAPSLIPLRGRSGPDNRRTGRDSRRWCCPPWSSPLTRTWSRIAARMRASACVRPSACHRRRR